MRVFAKIKEVSRQEWLALRRNGIGGSDAASLIGLNPFRGKFSVYMDKVGEEYQSFPTTYQMELGNKLEDFVAKEFEEKTGKKVRRCNEILQHDQHDFMLANVDRMLVGEKIGLECKVTNSFAKSDWDGKVPLYYQVQCQHYMAVTGYEGWYIAALIGNSELVVHYIQRDEEFIQFLIEKEKEFWNEHVLKKIAPMVDGSPDVDEYIKQKYPNAISEEPADLFNMEEDLELLETIKKDMKDLENKKTQIEQSVKLAMKEHASGESVSYKITYKNQASPKFDKKRLKEEHADLFKEYETQDFIRVLRISRKKGA